MCYGHIHFLKLTLGTTRDKKLSSEPVHNCPSNIKTRNMSHATHNLRAQRNNIIASYNFMIVRIILQAAVLHKNIQAFFYILCLLCIVPLKS